MKFKPGDHVRTIYEGIYYYGEISLVREGINRKKYKVLFNDLNYDYYDEDMLELITEKDLKDD